MSMSFSPSAVLPSLLLTEWAEVTVKLGAKIENRQISPCLSRLQAWLSCRDSSFNTGFGYHLPIVLRWEEGRVVSERAVSRKAWQGTAGLPAGGRTRKRMPRTHERKPHISEMGGSAQQSEERWGRLQVPIRGSQAETGRCGGANSSEECSENTLQQQRKLRQKENTFHTNKHDSLHVSAHRHLKGLQKTRDYIYPPNIEHLNLTRSELNPPSAGGSVSSLSQKAELWLWHCVKSPAVTASSKLCNICLQTPPTAMKGAEAQPMKRLPGIPYTRHLRNCSSHPTHLFLDRPLLLALLKLLNLTSLFMSYSFLF